MNSTALRAGCAALAVGLFGDAPAVLAQPARTEAQSKLEAENARLQATEGKRRAAELEVDALRSERERINARLLETADLIQKSEARLTETEARLAELGAQERILRGSLNQRRDKIAQLLAVLQRMGRNPPPVMVTKREDALAMVRSAMLLAAAFPGMRTQALALAQQLEDLIRVMTDIRAEGERLKAETQRLTDARTRLSGLMVEKKQSLDERRAELDDLRQAATQISENVRDLNDLIVNLDREVAKSEQVQRHNEKAAEAIRVAEAAAAARQAGLAAAPQAQAGDVAPATPAVAAETTPANAPAGTPPVTGGPAPGRPPLPVEAAEKSAPKAAPGKRPGEVEVAVLAPSASNFGGASAGRIEPAIPFQLAKGRLPLPTRGKRVLNFGERTQYGGASKGIVFETRHSAQITSPCDGWIVYAGEFRSYGQLLIINAGGGYHVLLAGMTRIDVQPGQFVLAAEPVGVMSDAPPALESGTAQTAPVLYVEFRRDGRPVDPNPWWVGGS